MLLGNFWWYLACLPGSTNGPGTACAAGAGWTDGPTVAFLFSMFLIVSFALVVMHYISKFDSTVLIILVLGLMFALAYVEWFPLWIPIGIVFLAVVWAVFGSGSGLHFGGGSSSEAPSRSRRQTREFSRGYYRANAKYERSEARRSRRSARASDRAHRSTVRETEAYRKAGE